VTIDGTDLRDVTLHSLREHIALVTQEPFLFDGTVRKARRSWTSTRARLRTPHGIVQACMHASVLASISVYVSR
jgi:ABC-type bacteriocin/lantibiotic exporter with double-glycine peptidase domain